MKGRAKRFNGTFLGPILINAVPVAPLLPMEQFFEIFIFCALFCYQMIYRRLRAFVGKHPEKWDEFLDAALWSMRSKRQATTKFSPFKVLYGREPNFAVQLEEIPETFEVCLTYFLPFSSHNRCFSVCSSATYILLQMFFLHQAEDIGVCVFLSGTWKTFIL